MQKLFITLSFIALSYGGQSQDLSRVFEDTTFEGTLLRLSSFNYYASNNFNNALTDKFIKGGQITTEIKDKAKSNLGRLNTFGAQAEQRVEHFNGSIHPIRNTNYGLVVSFSDHHLFSSNISSDLFETAMYGNANLLNDTMDFAFSHVQYLHYQKMGVGVFEKKTLSSIKINYVAGSKGFEGRLTDSWMHSSLDTVSLNFQGAGYKTDRFSPYFGFQGAGFAVDLNYNFLFETKKGNAQILNLKINNLGLIVWNNQTQNYAVDSLSTYNGFDIQNFINQPDDAENKEYNFIDTLGIQSARARYVGTLPIEFSLQKLPLRNSNQKLQYLVGFKTILTSDYFPYLYGGLYYAPSENFSASTRLSYGGFGGFQWGLNMNLWIKDKAYIGLGTYNMIGFISENIGYGKSIHLSANFKL